MKYSLQQLSDRQEIQALALAYSEAIDRRDFDRLDAVFTADAYIDYAAMGGEKDSYPEVKKFLASALPMVGAFGSALKRAPGYIMCASEWLPVTGHCISKALQYRQRR